MKYHPTLWGHVKKECIEAWPEIKEDFWEHHKSWADFKTFWWSMLYVLFVGPWFLYKDWQEVRKPYEEAFLDQL